MKAGQTIRIALTGLRANKLRSSLTTLGVVIGVASVIALLSIGRGSQAAITSRIESMGTNLVFVSPGASSTSGVRGAAGSANTLTINDAEAIAAQATAVSAVAPYSQAMVQIIAGTENTRTQVLGVTANYASVRNLTVAEGTFITTAQVNSRSLVVVLGSSVAETLFGTTNPVGESVKINGYKYTVVGVLQSQGSTAMGNQDDMVLAPITTVQYRLSSQKTSSGERTVQGITVQVTSASQIDTAIQQITAILDQRHEVASGSEDFTVSSQESMIETLQSSTGVFVIFLAAIAGISLLVGGIGIMNIMLVSVTERTREIGIRKAVGAKRQDIMFQFLTEAAALSLLGGAIGMLAGWAISRLVSGMTINSSTIQTVMSGDILILAVSVSAAIGIVFGLYPAYRASRLNPIDALRYE